MADERGPVHSSLHPSVHVDGEVVATKRIGGYRHLTLTAPGVPERFRAGNFVAVSVAGPAARPGPGVYRGPGSPAPGPPPPPGGGPRGGGAARLPRPPARAHAAHPRPP